MNRTTKRSPRQALIPKPYAARKDWQLQEAKARFSEVFRLARESGPQRVTKHGRTAVVVLPAEEYDRLSKSKARQGSLARFFADSPLAGSGVQSDRPRDFGRAIKL
jgi:prevent-host-death family protein